MSEFDAVLVLLGSAHTEGYGNTPIPFAIDDGVRSLVTSLVALDATERHAAVSRMTEKHGFVLLTYAERMAVLAVRNKNPGYLADGLAATAIAAMLVYLKETFSIVSLLFRSAEKLGLDLESTSANVATFGNKDFDEFIQHFPKRSQADRKIEAMGYVERDGQEGFLYERTW